MVFKHTGSLSAKRTKLMMCSNDGAAAEVGGDPESMLSHISVG